MHGSLDQREPTNGLTTSSAVTAQLMLMTDRQTDMQTILCAPSAATGHIYAHLVTLHAMRPNNNKRSKNFDKRPHRRLVTPYGTNGFI